MKEWYNIEDLNESLGNDLDIDQAWTRFKNKKKRRVLPILIPAFFGIGILLFGIYFLITSNQSSTSKTEVVENDVNYTDLNTNNDIEESHLNTYEKGLVLVDRDSINLTKTESKVITNSSLQKISSQNENKIIEGTGDIAAASRAVTTSGEKLSSHNQKIRHNSQEDVYGMEQKATADQNEYVGVKAITKINQLDIHRSGKKDHFVNENITLTNKSHKIKFYPLQLAPVADRLQFLPSNGVQYLPVLQMITVPEYTNDRSKWTVGFIHSIGMMNRSMKSDQAYDLQRRDEERVLESNHFQFSIGRNLGSRLHISTGITLGHYRTKLTHQIQRIFSPEFYDNSVIRTFTQNGITENVIGTAVGSKTVITENIRYQRYQNISIPIDLGFTVAQFNGWSIGLEIGMEYSIYSQVKGNTIDSIFPTGEYIPIDQLGYRSYGLMEGKYSLSVRRQIANHLFVHAGYTGRRDINSRLVESETVDLFGAHSFSFGLTLGL